MSPLLFSSSHQSSPMKWCLELKQFGYFFVGSAKSVLALSGFFVSSLSVKILTSFIMLKTPSPTFLITSKIALAMSNPSVVPSAVLLSLTGKGNTW